MRKVVFLFVTITLALSTLGVTPVFAITPESTTVSIKDEKVVENIERILPEYGHELNFDYAKEGVVSVFYNNRSEKKIKLVVQLDDEKYIYNVFNNAQYVNYPLQLGNGRYKISLYENTTGTKYKKIASQYYQVELTDENNVYLQSVLEIKWEDEDESIKLANELVADALEAKKETVYKEDRDDVQLTEEEIINELYTYVIKNIKYDYEKIKGLDYSYVPTNDITLEIGTGICYDYSSLLASMLRSQGIPTKMVKGYANTSDVYHAWNEIYLTSEERWVVVDPTYDAYREQKGYYFTFEKESENYNKVKEF